MAQYHPVQTHKDVEEGKSIAGYYPGKIIKKYRKLKGWTQQKLADNWPKKDGDIGADFHYIQLVERGKRNIVAQPILRKVSVLLDIPLSEFGFCEYDPYSETQDDMDSQQEQSDQGPVAEASMPSVTQEGSSPLNTAPSHIESIIESDQEREGNNMDEDRRLWLQETIDIARTGILLPAGEELNSILERLAKVLEKPSRIDEITLMYLEVRSEQLRREHNQAAMPSYSLVQQVAIHLDNVVTLLEASLISETYERLCAIASSSAFLMAGLLFDLAYYDKSMKFCTFAIQAAQEGKHPIWEAIAWGKMSLSLAYNEDTLNALASVLQGRSVANSSEGTGVCAWLAAIESEMRAKLGHSDACRRALDDAELSANDPTYEIWTGYDSLRVQGFKGVCYKTLFNPKKRETFGFITDAQTALKKAIELADQGTHNQLSVYLSDLASTHVQQKDVEEACKLTTRALLANTRKSGMIIQRIAALRQELDAWKDTESVKALDKQLEIVSQPEWYRGKV